MRLVPVITKVLLVVFVVWAVGYSAILWSLRRKGLAVFRFPPSDGPGPFEGDRASTFRVSGRLAFMRGGGRITLQVDETHAALSGFVWTKVNIERDRCTAVHAVDYRRGGLRFESADGRYDGVLIWSAARPEITAALADLGWPVEDAGSDDLTT